MMRGREATEYSTCSPTVPGGDTLCLTAGDARRVNPWSGDAASPSDTGGVAQHPLLPARVAPFSYGISTKNEIFFCYAKRLHNPFLTLHRQTKGSCAARHKKVGKLSGLPDFFVPCKLFFSENTSFYLSEKENVSSSEQSHKHTIR